MIKAYAVTLFLIAANVACFVLELVRGGSEDGQMLLMLGAAYAPYIMEGELYRLLCSMFLHFGITHLGNNMIALWALGSYLEPKVGHIRLFVIYLLGGLAGNLASFAWELFTGDFAVSVGASGGVFALFGCVLSLFLFRREYVRELSLVRMLLALGFLVAGSFEADINVAAHIGGLAGGWLAGTVCLASLPVIVVEEKHP